MPTIDEYLDRARAKLPRVAVVDLRTELESGAVLVDIRPQEMRSRDGEVPGALVIDRNVLEWRLAPSSEARNVEVEGRRVILFCDEGYASSLAAVTLRELGVDATDLIGGFQAWRAGTG